MTDEERPAADPSAPLEGPESADIRAMRGPTRRRALVMGAVGLGLVGVAGIALVVGRQIVVAQEAAQLAERRETFAALHACIAGGALAPGELMRERIRMVQLGDKPEGVGAWPSDCEAPLSRFYQTLEGDEDATALARHMREKLGCDKACGAADLPVEFPEIEKLARGLKIEVPATANATDWPRPLKADAFRPLVPGRALVQSVAELDAGRTALLYKDPGAAATVCIVDPEKTNPVVCNPSKTRVAAASARLLEGESRPIIFGITRATVGSRARPLGEDQAGRSNPFGPGGASGAPGGAGLGGSGLGPAGIGRLGPKPKKSDPVADEAPNPAEVERGAFLAENGESVPVATRDVGMLARHSGWLVDPSDKEIVAVFVKDGVAGDEVRFDRPKSVRPPWIVGNTLTWQAEGALAWKKLDPRSDKAGKTTRIETSAANKSDLCASEGSTVALFGQGARASMARLTNGDWSTPLTSDGVQEIETKKPASPPTPSANASPSGSGRYAVKRPSDGADPHIARQAALKDAAEFGMIGLMDHNSGIGANSGLAPAGAAADPYRDIGGDRTHFACSGGDAVHTHATIAGGDIAIEQLRCTSSACTAKKITLRGVRAASLWATATLGDEVIVLYRGPHQELRMRRGAIDALGTARESVVFDTPDYGGPKAGEPRAFAGGSTMVLVFQSEAGLFGVRIHRGGVSPITG